ncbi:MULTISPECIES: TraR/DksA family transcriptional regulator [Pseudoalteromonas]|uniref:Conjugal transfer protein TraR n=1 Tax=Pseudoalteromonas amylolytica TaxID=1859457 RepID=A0A1S1MZE5_9GAMM|nr:MULTISPECIES: conjugal transfer protein TraR [Pseudoalteromonas]MCF6435110.1 conjugal transfer protein TraR [Pseudoalteromonas sp. MMG022]OHU87724.1 conjugal transfer protein TraR [Pseudoalteromonas sp. JW3]OHU91166.1 conjugal transfer protein TraR [Pseudoalteromonas amylolytica]
MNSDTTRHFQDQLQSELTAVRKALLEELKQSSQKFANELAKSLEQSSPSEWLDIAATQLNPQQYPNFQRLLKLEAALCQIDIGQFGYCCDCETQLNMAELKADPTIQRCNSCCQKRHTS